MNPKMKNDSTDRLFQCILQLKDLDECYAFFEDLCTIHEIQSLAQRLDVAHMLSVGKTYIEIGEVTGASTATISRVNRSLQYGSDGYKMALSRTLPAAPEESGV